MSSDRWAWIRDLVKAEEQMEDTGLVDLSVGIDNEKYLQLETLKLLTELKSEFVESSNAFNQLKASPLGTIKIYGIAKTAADFMLFRNGFKMIFSQRASGAISIRFNFISPGSMIPSRPLDPAAAQGASASAGALMDEHIIEGKRGPFGELVWCFQDQPVKLESIVKFHLSLFIKESSR